MNAAQSVKKAGFWKVRTATMLWLARVWQVWHGLVIVLKEHYVWVALPSLHNGFIDWIGHLDAYHFIPLSLNQISDEIKTSKETTSHNQ